MAAMFTDAFTLILKYAHRFRLQDQYIGLSKLSADNWPSADLSLLAYMFYAIKKLL